MNTTAPEPTPRKTILAIALLCVGAIAVAFMPSTAKLAFREGANTETVVAIRAFTGATLLGLYLLIRGGEFRIPASLVGAIIVASLASALMNYTFYSSIHFLAIGLATLIIFTNPLWVALYYHKTGASRLTPFRLGCGFAALFGVGLTLAIDFGNVSVWGIFLASVAALSATVMVLAIVRVNEESGGVTTNFHLSFWTLVLFVIVLMTVGSVQWPGTTLGWGCAIGNGIAYIIAYLTFLMAASLIGASRASMLTFMEPVAAILLAAFLFGEQLSAIQWLGVGIVLVGLFALEAPTNLFRTRSPSESH